MPTCVMPNAQGFLAVVADMSQTACEARSGADATIQALRNLVVSFIKCTL